MDLCLSTLVFCRDRIERAAFWSLYALESVAFGALFCKVTGNWALPTAHAAALSVVLP
jgi:hypothetical protein